MSATIPAAPAAPSIPPYAQQIVKDATTIEGMIQTAIVAYPPLAAALTSTVRPASLTPLGSVAGVLIVAVAKHYGLTLDDDTTAVLAGLAALGAGYATHWVQGLFAKPIIPVAPAAAKGDAP